MTRDQDPAIRRRPDGSIDIEFYARRAALLRCAARRQEPAHWAARLCRAVAKLAAAARLPRAARALGKAALGKGMR